VAFLAAPQVVRLLSVRLRFEPWSLLESRHHLRLRVTLVHSALAPERLAHQEPGWPLHFRQSLVTNEKTAHEGGWVQPAAHAIANAC
jgi:hypothetical protein